VNVPAEQRGLSMVFQSYAIWPHMSMFDNVAYGLRVRKRPEVTTRVREALDLVQLGDLGGRSASKLSGGQQQRVALARAFVFSPSVLLFDEPLSNLDAKLRAEMRVELKELQRRLDITSVYVTHDLEEALAISDRIVVMRDGVIEQVGTPAEIYDRPRNTFVADFVGSANLIRGATGPTSAATGSWCWRRRVARSSTASPPTVGPAPRRSWPCARCGSASIGSARRPRSTSGPPACAVACFRATSPSTISTGTAAR
jgi:ABC-type Fe3+/spermidine/putrescine transport system ATPase subunit